MGRFFVVGDVHGCASELDRLLEALELGAQDRILFLGDYVDRGPGSKEVIDRLLELRDRSPVRTTFLKGNHEDMFLGWLGRGGRYGEAFLANGGRQTVSSYGLDPESSGVGFAERLPPAHLAFLESLSLFEIAGRFLFVHAGVRPLTPLEHQSEEDLLWIRDEFLRNRHPLPYTIVFGHSVSREVLWDLPYKIGIDTGCVYGGKLSSLELSEGVLFQVPKGSSRAIERREDPELRAVACRFADPSG